MAEGAQDRRGYCPFYRYGQCIVAPPSMATVVVVPERCKKYWATCRLYLQASGKLKDKGVKAFNTQRNSLITDFLDCRPHMSEQPSPSSSTRESRGERHDKKARSVLRALLELQQEDRL